LVLPILVVDQDEHAAVPGLLDDVLDRGEEIQVGLPLGLGGLGQFGLADFLHGHRVATSRATYRASMSTSMFRRLPGCTVPKVVQVWVWGITLTPKSRPSTSFTVKETPSSATDPLGATKRARSSGA